VQCHMVRSLHIRLQIVVFGQSLQSQQLKPFAIEVYVTDLLVFPLFLLEFGDLRSDSLFLGHLMGLAEEIRYLHCDATLMPTQIAIGIRNAISLVLLLNVVVNEIESLRMHHILKHY